MSLEEPKAPIVRIRKKRTRKKTKENDIVHLPVRASQQARYSSLTTTSNPQTKSRECCRHMFAGCMKIPLCRLLCFRCILPKCYSGEGSDDDGEDIRDEGYHSQNRQSTELSQHAEGGAQRSGEQVEVEMTEIKGETVKLIPPPRKIKGDYHNKESGKQSKNLEENERTTGEVTYIEVESVSLDVEASSDIPNIGTQSEDTSVTGIDTLQSDYEEPVRAGVLEFPMLKPIQKTDSLEYVECDHSDDSDESKYYINESVLGVHDHDSNASINTKAGRNYMNFDSVKKDKKKMPIKSTDNGKETDVQQKKEKPHEYVNVHSLEKGTDSKTAVEKCVDEAQENCKQIKTLKDNHSCVDSEKEETGVGSDNCDLDDKNLKNGKPNLDNESDTDMETESKPSNDQTKLI